MCLSPRVAGGAGGDYDGAMVPSGNAGSFRLVTFGCKANQYDSQLLREALAREGWREVEGEADLVVINSCTVTGEAGRKARQLIRRIARRAPETRIALAGCLARGEAERLRELSDLALVVDEEGEAAPEALLRGIEGLPLLGGQFRLEESAEESERFTTAEGISRFHGHTRAFLKIQDGCDMACAYCIVPSVRGGSRSRRPGEIAGELRRLLAAGHREIVLCGIHIGHWGRESGSELGVLLEELASIEALDEAGRAIDWRMRLSSIEATEATGSVLAALVRHPRRIAPHLHLPLQSGDDRVLRSMRRWYRAERFLACCEEIREVLDRPGLTTDVILGFPGEDEEAFENTLEVVRRVPFSRIHAFPFSPRPGTAAERPEEIGRPVEPSLLRERRSCIAELGGELGAATRRELVGLRERVIVETSDDPEAQWGWIGRYQRVRVAPSGLLPLSGLLEVELTLDAAPSPPDHGGASLLGRPVPDALETPPPR
jgi:threonylcarbamoyladenosine tRNA methylthiotransferase MtaB